ncbi:MAG: MMPL family transporter [Bacteroidota bacterium]
MASLFVKIFDFFQTRKHLLFAMLILISTLLTYFASRVHFSEDIADFIPKNKEVKNISDVFEQIKSNDKLIVIITNPDTSEGNIDKTILQADDLAKDIKDQMVPDMVKDITYSFSNALMMDTYDLFWRNLPYFLDKNDYKHIAETIDSVNAEKVLSRNYKMMISPAGFVMKKYLIRDPFSITGLAIRKLALTSIGNNYLMFKERVFSKDKKNMLMFISTVNPASETSKNAVLIKNLEDVIAHNTEKYHNSGTKIQYYGGAAVAVGNANQLKNDSLLTVGIAIIVLFVFFGYFFKNRRTIFFLILPVIFGSIFSLAIIYFIKNEISSIAIGASSIILGIAINYSIHFYAHYRHEKSLRQVIKDLAMPMTIGSTTTIGAFLGLLMVKSSVLNDFGLLSALVLVGAVLFTLIFLPYFVKKPKNAEPESASHNFIDKLSSYHFERNPYILIGVIVLTVFFMFFATNIGFESDLTKMNYMSDKLKASEQTLNTISDSSLRPIYIVAHGANMNEALQNNEQIGKKVKSLQNQHLINQVSSVTNIMLSGREQDLKVQQWNAFWATMNIAKLKKRLIEQGKHYKFNEEAFDGFFQIITRRYNRIGSGDFDYLKKHFVSDLISQQKNTNFAITLLKINPKNRDKIVSYFPENDSTTIIDRQYLSARYADIISSDFNTILLISSLLVFFFLLMMYGRIELALISFIPMFISWIWILGLMSLLGFKFNVFSIIISTFIFGLGDDFSIFIMDGLLQEYKRKGVKLLNSYKTAVFLSAFTTLVGVGVLIFAKHPALKSIALLTIIGMFSVVFLSYTVPPALFRLLVYHKQKLRKFPVTAYGFLYALVCYSWFVSGCILTGFLGLTLYKILPLSKKKKQLLYHYTLFAVCRSTMYVMYFAKKKVINYNREMYRKPALIIANHQSIIDIPLLLMFSPKVIMITNDAFYYSKFIGIIVKLGGFMPASAGYGFISEKLSAAVANGYSIVVFPEGTRRNDGLVHRFHKGAFYLAEKLQLDILPMITHGTGNYVAKGELMAKKSQITVKFLDRIAYGDATWGEDYSVRTKKVQDYFRKEYELMMNEFYNTPRLLNDIIIKNFIYKGPIVEWYTRIKLAIERKNYQLYNNLIPHKAHILDMGCGYGYLAMMLGMISSERRITAVDYDQEKIEVARHCMSKPKNVDFFAGDIRTIDIEPHDVFILSDVLHYLSDEKQIHLLEACIYNLNPYGKILIRDGNADLDAEHKKTRLTEYISTHIGFNKTHDMKLHFLSATRLHELCQRMGATLQIVDKGGFTSNWMFLIEKGSRKSGEPGH